MIRALCATTISPTASPTSTLWSCWCRRPHDGGLRRQQPSDAGHLSHGRIARAAHFGRRHVVGFDDLPFADWVTPRLTTVPTPLADMTALAACLVPQAQSGLHGPRPPPSPSYGTVAGLRRRRGELCYVVRTGSAPRRGVSTALDRGGSFCTAAMPSVPDSARGQSGGRGDLGEGAVPADAEAVDGAGRPVLHAGSRHNAGSG